MKNKRILIFMVPLTVIFTLACLWFIFWRPGDTEYQAAQSSVETLRNDATKVTNGLEGIETMGQVGPTVQSNLEILSSSYKSAATKLATYPAVTRDWTVNATYESVADSINDYGQRLSNLAASVKLYMSIGDACSKLDGKVVSESAARTQREQEFQACQNAINAGQFVSDKAFYDGFMKNYLLTVNNLLDQYDRFYGATNATKHDTAERAINKIKQSIVDMGATKLETSLGTPPTEELSELTSVLNSQKNMFFR